MLHLKAAESFLETRQCTSRTQQHECAEKSGLRDEKRADIIRNWRSSGLKHRFIRIKISGQTDDFFKE